MTGARNFILRLSLTTQSYHFGGSPVYALTSFLHALSWRSATRSRATKACERFDYLATTIYSEWVIKHIAGGERLYTNAQLKTRSAQLPGLRYVISKLMDAATWDCPANLVGRATPERYASIFNLGCRYDPAGRIRSTLSELIVDAGQHLSRVFAVRDIYIDGQRHTLRRACYDGRNDISTCLPLNEEKMPWNSEIAWTQTSPKLMINLAPAGKDVLDAIQLEEDDTTSAAEANEAWAAWDAVRTAAGADLE